MSENANSSSSGGNNNNNVVVGNNTKLRRKKSSLSEVRIAIIGAPGVGKSGNTVCNVYTVAYKYELSFS